MVESPLEIVFAFVTVVNLLKTVKLLAEAIFTVIRSVSASAMDWLDDAICCLLIVDFILKIFAF